MGSDGRKSLRKLNKIADKVEELDGKYAAMDDDQLKGRRNSSRGVWRRAKRWTIFCPTLLRRCARRPGACWA